MNYPAKEMKLKNGETCLLRAPVAEEGAEMMAYLKACAGETPFILRTPEECVETAEQEARFLENIVQSATQVMIVCQVAGKIAGNCTLSMNRRVKTRHRASIAIALRRDYWGLGIGTALMREMEEIARAQGVLQLELQFIEGNSRARSLYEKMGFRIVGVMPDAFCLSPGDYRHEYFMVKRLDASAPQG